MHSLDQPFVFFDDARGRAVGRYYHKLHDEFYLREPQHIYDMAQVLRKALQSGFHVAGYLSYEAGLLLEERTAPLLDHILENGFDEPLGWFGIFDGYDAIEDGSKLLSGGAASASITPQISYAEYCAAFDAVQNYIRNGDIYQANLTFRCDGEFSGDILALYAKLRGNAAAGYGGIINMQDHAILSFSPELFFTLKDGSIAARPMKGTAKVLPDSAANAAAKEALSVDPKQRAENLMIVDLLRNDLSKICKTASVDVPALFHVESYPTVPVSYTHLTLPTIGSV